MKTIRSFANEEAEANVYWQKLQQVYKLNKREAMAYTYYVWSSGVSGSLRGAGNGQGIASDPQMHMVQWHFSTSKEPYGVSPALISTASDALSLPYSFPTPQSIFHSPLRAAASCH